MVDNNKPKLALVTGAGHRLGAAIAKSVVDKGYSLILHYHSSEAKAKKLADSLRLAGATIYLVKADLTKTNEIVNLWEYIDGLNGTFELLINSASILPKDKFGSISPAEIDATINLNLRAPFLCAQEAAKRMGGGGQIINISDIAASLDWSRFPLYSISKSALDSMTRILAKTLAPSIRVNGIAPGLILPSEDLDVEEWDVLIEKVPLKRSGSIEEITLAVIFLLENKYITGQTLVIDGGRSLK